MIISIAKKMATYIGNKLNSSKDDMEIYDYGLQILLGAIIKVIVIIVVGWIFNALSTTIVLFVVYAVFRCFGGGAHLSTYPKCLIFGISLIVTAGYLSQLHLNRIILETMLIFTFVLAILICLKIVPAGTEKKQINDMKIRLQQKIKFLNSTLVWAFTDYYFLMNSQNKYALAMILGCLCSLLLITPLGYQLFKLIDKLAI